MTLYVDDEVLVECLSADLGGDPNKWCGKFRFVGERNIDFNVFEETKDGVPLDKKVIITKPYQYSHAIEVTYPHKALDNLGDATLTIDGVDFARLPMLVQERGGTSL